MGVNIADFNSYKSCRTKQYRINFCMPPEGTVIIDKAANSGLSKMLHGRTMLTQAEYQRICNEQPRLGAIIAQSCQCTNKDTPIVMLGMLGQCWLISYQELAMNYTFTDGRMINSQLMGKLVKNGCIDWRPVLSKANVNAKALFVPLSQRFTTIAAGNKLSVNNSGINHGKGDFVVMLADPAGNPYPQTVHVVNGIEFRESYDNRGWADCLDLNYILKAELPKSIMAELKITDLDSKSEILDVIETILKQCEADKTRQLKFNHMREGDKIIVRSSVIANYARDNAIQTPKGKTKVCTNIETHISINRKEEKFVMKYYNVYTNSKQLNAEIVLELNSNLIGYIQMNKYVLFGLMGYVRSSVRNYFTNLAPYTREEHQGMMYYTTNSSGINRICRGSPKDKEEKLGEYREDIMRALHGTDGYLDKSIIAQDGLMLFRGVPAHTVINYSGHSFDALEGAILPDTAFMSTSLNAATAPMFSQPDWTQEPGNNPNGVMIVIKNTRGIHAAYVHEIAAWQEQFEVTIDRRYDIKIGRTLTEFRRRNGIIKVVEGEFVQHTPNGPIANQKLINQGHTAYDENGKVGFEVEVLEDEIHKAYTILRNKGYSSLLFYEPSQEVKVARGIGNAIVAQSESTDEIVTDIAYSLDKSGDEVFIAKHTIKGPREKLRAYWREGKRKGGNSDVNFVWSSYGADYAMSKGEQVEILGYDLIMIPQDADYKTLASIIGRDIKYSKDMMLFPLQDIARYFNTVFAENILLQGYEIKGSGAANRVGSDTNPQDGYVPLKFLIDGDNDDNLMLYIKISRNSNKDLVIKYSGRSQNNKVNESKETNYNEFNAEIAHTIAQEILQCFASKLSLCCTRKFRRVLHNWCVRRRFSYAPIKLNVEDKPGEHKEAYSLIGNINGMEKRYLVLVNRNNNCQYKIGAGVDKSNLTPITVDSRLDVMSLCRSFDQLMQTIEYRG